MLGWALRLTGFDAERAEDLVHDAFVHFSTARPDLNAILPNLEGYLYTMLRNLNLSNVRRTTRLRARLVALSDASLAEFESLEAGLRAASESTQLQVQEQLYQICLYACARKESSKAGSVLILRFFHGYYPSEIALVCRSSRGAVDEWMRVARSEVKNFLAKPPRSKNKSSRLETSGLKFGTSNEEFVRELREAIFDSQPADCPSVGKLEELYRAERAASGIDAALLGHVVSCRRCLDEVNRLLQMPSLSERNPSQMLGPDTRRRAEPARSGAEEPADDNSPSDDNSDDDSDSGAPGVEDLMNRSRRRLRDVLEHKPKELRICVNGRVVETAAVGSELTKRGLELGEEDGAVSFVEIFSESEVRLLFCNVEALPSAQSQRTLVELSDGRTLELIVDSNGRAPALRVSYHDPTFEEQAAALPETGDEDEPRADARRKTAWGELLRLPGRLSGAARSGLSLPVWIRPGAALTAALLLASAIALVLFLRAPTRSVSAAELLRKSAAAEARINVQQPGSISHRAFKLEEIDAASGKTVALRRVEIWKNPSSGVSARRLFDEREQLIAGEWQNAGGERKIYRLKAAETTLAPATEETAGGAPPQTDEAWLLEPSTQIFSALVGRAEESRVEERAAAYVLSFQGTGERGEGGLSRASLTLNKSDLSPAAMSLLMRRGGVLREHRFTVTGSERRAAKEVSPSVFEPDAVLLAEADVSVETRAKANEAHAPAATGVGADALAPRPPTATAAPASAELEIETLRLLNQAGADLGEQLSVNRTPEGKLLIKAVVETAERKQTLLNSLAPVANNPSVVIEMLTASEALEKQRGQKGSTRLELPEADSQAAQIPLAAELRRHFSRSGTVPEEEVESEVRRFAARAVERSSQVLQHAWAIKRLASRFSESELSGLSAEARSKWMSLIRSHARSLQQQAALQRQELAPLFNGGAASDEAASATQINGERDLSRAADLLVELCSAEHRATRAAFTISPAGSREASARVARTASSLRKIEKLAASMLDAPQK